MTSTTTPTPETVEIPKELLLEDFKQQCTNLQGQYTRMHNRLQLLIGLNTALLPTLGAVALAASNKEVGRGWIFLFPAAGLLLSAIGYLTGATDRNLVTIYRDQLSWTAKCLAATYKETPFRYQHWLHIGLDPGKVNRCLTNWKSKSSEEDGPPSGWDRVTSWRWKPLTVTRLPVALSLVLAAIWLVIIVLLLII
jgi:hypothetical protein